jgi:hypothetical protein
VETVSFATQLNTRLIIRSPKTQYLAVERHFLQNCLRAMIERIDFDEGWYLQPYPNFTLARHRNGARLAPARTE